MIIKASAGTGGSITPSGDVEVDYGTDKTFTITANVGYEISDVKVNNESKGALSTYTFSKVKQNGTIAASFNNTKGYLQKKATNPLPLH